MSKNDSPKLVQEVRRKKENPPEMGRVTEKIGELGYFKIYSFIQRTA